VKSNVAHAPLVALIICVMLVACDDDDDIQPLPFGRVQGTVTRVDTGEPVIDAKIVLIDVESLLPAPETGRTDGAGAYSIAGVPPGAYAVVVYNDSLFIFDRSGPPVQVVGSGTVTADIRLLKSVLWSGFGYRIEGTVTDSMTEAPISGAFVGINAWAIGTWNQDVPLITSGVTLPVSGVTDEAGRFSVLSPVLTDFGGEPVGLFPISITKAGYASFTLVGDGAVDPLSVFGPPLPLPAGHDSTLTVEVRLDPFDREDTGALQGRVTTLDGEPIAQVPVSMSLFEVANPDTLRDDGPAPVPVPLATAATAADGSFFVDGLTPGTYVVAAAYRPDDGYVLEDRDTELVSVAAADTADAGVMRVVAAIRPLTPVPGSRIGTTTPRFSWEPVPGADAYRLEWGAGHILESIIDDLAAPEWQVPEAAPLPDGSFVRWTVTAKQGDPFSRVIARAEEVWTFTVESADAARGAD
jgi:hypothetical protein